MSGYQDAEHRFRIEPQHGARSVVADIVRRGAEEHEVVGLQPVSPMNLVHPDGFHTAQLAVSQAPLYKRFHCEDWVEPAKRRDGVFWLDLS